MFEDWEKYSPNGTPLDENTLRCKGFIVPSSLPVRGVFNVFTSKTLTKWQIIMVPVSCLFLLTFDFL